VLRKEVVEHLGNESLLGLGKLRDGVELTLQLRGWPRLRAAWRNGNQVSPIWERSASLAAVGVAVAAELEMSRKVQR